MRRHRVWWASIVAMVVAASAAADWPPRMPRKCGRVIALRAEAAARDPLHPIAWVPFGCTSIAFPLGYRVRQAPGSSALELWRAGTRLVPVAGHAQPAAPPPRRGATTKTITTREFWTRDAARHLVHVTEQEEEAR